MSEELEILFDPYQDIAAATNALQAIDGLDSFDKEERAMIQEVRTMSLKIIYNAIQLIYSLHGEETEAD